MCRYIFFIFVILNNIALSFEYAMWGDGGLNFYHYSMAQPGGVNVLEEFINGNFKTIPYVPNFNETNLSLSLKNLNNLSSDSNNIGWGGNLSTIFFKRASFPLKMNLYRRDLFSSQFGEAYRDIGEGWGAGGSIILRRYPSFYLNWNDDYSKSLSEDNLLSRRRTQNLNLYSTFGGGVQRTDFSLNKIWNDDLLSGRSSNNLHLFLFNTVNPASSINILNQLNFLKSEFEDGRSFETKNFGFSHSSIYEISPTHRLTFHFNTSRAHSNGIESRGDGGSLSLSWYPRPNFGLNGGFSLNYSRYANGITGGSLLYTNNANIITRTRIWRLNLQLGYNTSLGLNKPEGQKEGFYLSNSAGLTNYFLFPDYIYHALSSSYGNILDTSPGGMDSNIFRVQYEMSSKEFFGMLRFYLRGIYSYSDEKYDSRKQHSRSGDLQFHTRYHYNQLLSSGLLFGFQRNSTDDGLSETYYISFDTGGVPLYALRINFSFTSSFTSLNNQNFTNTNSLYMNASYAIGKFLIALNASVYILEESINYTIFMGITRNFGYAVAL